MSRNIYIYLILPVFICTLIEYLYLESVDYNKRKKKRERKRIYFNRKERKNKQHIYLGSYQEAQY